MNKFFNQYPKTISKMGSIFAGCIESVELRHL